MFDNNPAPAEISQVRTRGHLQRPHTDSGPGSLQRKIKTKTIKINPSPEQYKRLRDIAWQAMRYKNHFIRAKLAQALGYQLPDSDDKNAIEKKIRHSDNNEKGELSAKNIIYSLIPRRKPLSG